MNGADDPTRGGAGQERPGEFETIARLLAPLTRGSPAALGLLDDAAVLSGRPGFDLVISQDAMVEGVHFLPDMPMQAIARRLLRAALSDLAAKAAEPAGYLLTLAWPAGAGWREREAFAAGLAEDGAIFEIALLGGDTVSTTGPFMASVTVLGWAPAGRMIRRSGARAGDLLVVSGTVGDGHLGLLAARGLIPPDDHLCRRFDLPQPRFDMRDALQAHARASADVSDGVLADAGHLAAASGLAVTIDLDRLPLSDPAARWLAGQLDRPFALAVLAGGGDDYEIVAAVAPQDMPAFEVGAHTPVRVIGAFHAGDGIDIRCDGRTVAADRTGWRHGG
jgi:thiamine-monophosphate kinase